MQSDKAQISNPKVQVYRMSVRESQLITAEKRTKELEISRGESFLSQLSLAAVKFPCLSEWVGPTCAVQKPIS
jgi:hypothetical protein